MASDSVSSSPPLCIGRISLIDQPPGRYKVFVCVGWVRGGAEGVQGRWGGGGKGRWGGGGCCDGGNV